MSTPGQLLFSALHNQQGQTDSVLGVAATERANLAELTDWVEGLRTAADKARDEGKIMLAEALEITRFEVYEGYLDEALYQPRRVRA